MKQRGLGTESRLSARIEDGGKRGSQSLFQFVYSIVSFLKNYKSFNPAIYSPTGIFPPLVYIPDNLSAQQKLTKSKECGKLSETEEKNDRNKDADNLVEIMK